MPNQNKIGKDHGDWLYCPDDNQVYADHWSQILHCQFADGSAVAPFHYHDMRSLGLLLYPSCHLQNRLQCKANDAIFEGLQQYFRVSDPNDRDRVASIDLHNYGILPDGVSMVPMAERWQVNANLVEIGFGLNRDGIQEAAAQYRQTQNQTPDSKEKTATQVMAEENASNALVGALTLQAGQYERFQQREILRRFFKANSADPDVREVRDEIVRAGIPEELLNIKAWKISPAITMGNGSQTLRIAIAKEVQGIRPNLDPESQRQADHDLIGAVSDDPAYATRMVPMQGRELSDTAHEADQSVATLLAGLPVRMKHGENQIEIIESWLKALQMKFDQLSKSNTKTHEDIFGLFNLGTNIGQRIQLLAQNKTEGQRVAAYGKALAQLMAQIEAMGKEFEAKQQQQQQPQGDGKAQSTMMAAQMKSKLAADAHAQKMKEHAETHQQAMASKSQLTMADVAAKDLMTAADIRRGGLKATAE
jgi:hypothetical protein